MKKLKNGLKVTHLYNNIMKKEKAINEITAQLSENLIRDGIIKIQGITDEQIRFEIKDYLLKNITAISGFVLFF